MSSHTARTHTTSAPPRRSGVSFGTLVAAAISSVVAATVVSRLWQAGTVMATAMTPVIVSVVKEALERPAQRVSSIATRSTAPRIAATARAVVAPPPEADAPPPPMALDPELTRMRVYGRERKVGRRWKLAVATGLLGFVVCVAVMTVPELVAGRSVVSAKHDTTIFGGRRQGSATTSKPDEKAKTDTRNTTTNKVTPKNQAPPTDQPDTTTTAPQTPAPQGQEPTQPAPQTQPAPTQTQPTVTQQPPAPAP
jgi:hypothetical protein